MGGVGEEWEEWEESGRSGRSGSGLGVGEDQKGFASRPPISQHLSSSSVRTLALRLLFRPNGGELKNNSIHLGFSRDGFHIARPTQPRTPFIATPKGVVNSRGKRLRISNLQLAQVLARSTSGGKQ